MKRSFFLLGIVGTLLVMSGCLFGSKYYTLSDSEKDPTKEVITMKAIDENSEDFTLRVDPTVWDIQIWDEEKAPNRVALVHKEYPEGDCFVLPGTEGKGYQDGWTVTEGALLTRYYTARSLLISNEVGIVVMYVVGFDVDNVSYVIEVNFPIKDQDACSADAQALISSFNADLPGVGVDDTQPVDEVPSDDSTTQDTTSTETTEETVPAETTDSTTPATEEVVQ